MPRDNQKQKNLDFKKDDFNSAKIFDSFWRKMDKGEWLRQKQKMVLILSGGLDSGVLLSFLRHLDKQVHALSFDYGSKHNEAELAKAAELCQLFAVKHQVLSLPFIGSLFQSSLLRSGGPIPDGHYQDDTMRQTVVPFRNGIMLAIAAGYAESIEFDLVLLGSHAGDHAIYPDCRPGFNEAMSAACRAGTYNGVQILSPFAFMDKREIAELGRAMDFDFLRTWTCYKGGAIHCGTCGACQERKYALGYHSNPKQNMDPTQYEN